MEDGQHNIWGISPERYRIKFPYSLLEEIIDLMLLTPNYPITEIEKFLNRVESIKEKDANITLNAVRLGFEKEAKYTKDACRRMASKLLNWENNIIKKEITKENFKKL